MIRSPLAIVLLATLAVTPLAAQDTTATQRTLYRLEEQWAQGVVHRDAAAIRRLVAPKWVYSDESGMMNREQGIASFTSGPDTVTKAGNEQMRAIVYGNTAVVSWIRTLCGRGANGPFDRRYRYTDTWMKLGGRWQCIASQDYLMPAEGAR
ncbi:MAG: nuclear transport factor 2 family protein [Gemmatimonadaceae bacterium]|nr:nuclear transport factor 2 family protein [Gemmatimonadaceae bacterium]